MRRLIDGLRSPGVLAALGAALLFGAAAPLAKQLLVEMNPWLLAGLLYAGSGIGLTIFRLLRPRARLRPSRSDWLWLSMAIVCGGVVAPVLLMQALSALPASSASLLLNAEGIFTALLAWIAFRENVDQRIFLGMMAICAGAIVLSWGGTLHLAGVYPVLLVLGACLAWAIDNNVTRKVSLLDASWIASVKGLVAGATNLTIASLAHARWPPLPLVIGAMGIGALAYGVSLVLFVVGLRHLGAARTGAYFSTAPFIGAALAILWLQEPLTLQLLFAALLMGIGVWLHLTERHEHEHDHEAMEHEHEHEHDEHHRHEHAVPVEPGVRHSHMHRHARLRHSHAHFPDLHHRHDHE